MGQQEARKDTLPNFHWEECGRRVDRGDLELEKREEPELRLEVVLLALHLRRNQLASFGDDVICPGIHPRSRFQWVPTLLLLALTFLPLRRMREGRFPGQMPCSVDELFGL